MNKNLIVAAVQSTVPQTPQRGEEKITQFVNSALFKSVDMMIDNVEAWVNGKSINVVI